MPKRILIGHQINPERGAMGVQLQNFVARNRAPIAPDRFVTTISESMLDIELKFIDLEIGKMVRQFHQRLQIWNASARDIEHNAASGKIRIISDAQARQTAAIFSQQLSQRGESSPETTFLTILNRYAARIYYQGITFRVIRGAIAL